jgi:hypothetical protein
VGAWIDAFRRQIVAADQPIGDRMAMVWRAVDGWIFGKTGFGSRQRLDNACRWRVTRLAHRHGDRFKIGVWAHACEQGFEPFERRARFIDKAPDVGMCNHNTDPQRSADDGTQYMSPYLAPPVVKPRLRLRTLIVAGFGL